MKIPNAVINIVGSVVGSVAIATLGDALQTMLPWLMVMVSVIICDLFAGLRKSLKLGIHVSISMAGRETMGKLVVYTSFVLMVAMIDAASGHDMEVAKWGCLLVCMIEGSSILSNILKPHGIDLSLQSIIKLFAKKKLDLTDEEASELVSEEQIDHVRRRERARWEARVPHEYGGVKQKSKKK